MYGAYGLHIDGVWRPAADGATVEVIDPATEEVLGAIPAAAPSDLDDALRSAAAGFERWRRTPGRERAAVLGRIGRAVHERSEEIARTVTLEMGKPLGEARLEVEAAAEQFEWNGEEARRIYGQLLDGRDGDTRLSVRFEPVGAVVAISPWNFPVLLPARKLAPALAAGCSVILKPSEEAPGAAFALAAIAREAGLPPGAFNLVTGEPSAISRHLLASPVIRKISFTGSVPVGKQLMKLAAEGLKKVAFELGGHAPVVIFEDADPIAAARATAAAKFRNAGQVCISPSRFFVHRSLIEPFSETFADVARNLVVGRGTEPGVEMGPLANPRRLEAARSLVADATSRGANLLAGGSPPRWAKRGYFFDPTVLSEVPEPARILREEPFVPVAPILPFDHFDEAIERANALPFGLAAYLFTGRLDTARRASDALEAGMIGINDLGLSAAEAPFGGVKESGIGRENGSLGIREYLEAKTVKTVI